MKRLILIFLITAQVFAGLNAKSGKVINMAEPTANTDGATKYYVDNTAAAAGHAILGVAHGDSTTDTVTRGSLIYGNSTPAWDELVLGASGYILRSDGTDAAWAATTNITALGTIATGTWQATDIGVQYGGTGASSLTDGGILLGSGTGAITAMSVLADGSIVVGDGTTDPVALAAFTSSTGDLKHESGGLEADVSGYTDGLYGMVSGATANIDTIAEIETAIGGSTNILTETEIDASSELLALMDDETGTGALVFATSPTLVTPALGTIASGVGTALTALDGENIQNDTIDDDSIDFGDITGADLDLTDCTTITTTGAGTIGDGLIVNADNDAQNHLRLEGKAGSASVQRGGSIEWYHNATDLAGYTFANLNHYFVWSNAFQDDGDDEGVAWVDMDDGSASFDAISVGKLTAPAEAVDVSGNIKCDGILKMWGSWTAEAGTSRAMWTVASVEPANNSTANFFGMVENLSIFPSSTLGTNTSKNLSGELAAARYTIQGVGFYDKLVAKTVGLKTLYAGDADFQGTITDTEGLCIDGMAMGTTFANGTIVNNYGLVIGDVSGGTTINRAIQTGAGTVLFGDKVMFTQTDGDEYIDSLADGYMDYGATTGHRFNANVDITGTVNTTSDDNWDLNDYTATGDYAAAGYVTVTINGTSYRLLAYPTP